MLNSVPFMTVEDEPRIMKKVKGMVLTIFFEALFKCIRIIIYMDRLKFLNDSEFNEYVLYHSK